MATETITKHLPIGVQDFESLIQDNFLYVDKTRRMDDWEIELLKSDTQGDTQDDTQGDTQGRLNGRDLDDWIVEEIRKNPNITVDELAALSNWAPITIKRHTAKIPGLKYEGSGYSGQWKYSPRKKK